MMTAYSRIPVTAGFLLAIAFAAPAQTRSPKLAAADLVKAVIHSELKPSDSGIRWKYTLYKQVDGKQETREVIETKSGSL